MEGPGTRRRALSDGRSRGAAAAGTGRIARLVDKIDDITSWAQNRRNRDRNDDNRDDDNRDDDGDGLTCRVNSFPTGTLVLMADGALTPIESVEPGDQVMAADVTTGTWQARPVLDQWSHLDRGQMATVTLSDGSAVSATDHHRFWVDVATGDRLLTPNGPIDVTTVTQSAEFDVDTDEYVIQSKPADFQVGSSWRNQAQRTFQAALASGRRPYFHFEGPRATGCSARSRSTVDVTASSRS